MQLRDQGLEVIYQRVKAQRTSLGLQSFKRTPTVALNEEDLPAIFMSEGVDEVVTSSSRGDTGYPLRRMLEVTLEIVVPKTSYNIVQMFVDVRKVIFEGGVVVADNTFFQEVRAEGPTGYGLPNVVGMRLVLALSYIDDGN